MQYTSAGKLLTLHTAPVPWFAAMTEYDWGTQSGRLLQWTGAAWAPKFSYSGMSDVTCQVHAATLTPGVTPVWAVWACLRDDMRMESRVLWHGAWLELPPLTLPPSAGSFKSLQAVVALPPGGGLVAFGQEGGMYRLAL